MFQLFFPFVCESSGIIDTNLHYIVRCWCLSRRPYICYSAEIDQSQSPPDRAFLSSRMNISIAFNGARPLVIASMYARARTHVDRCTRATVRGREENRTGWHGADHDGGDKPEA